MRDGAGRAEALQALLAPGGFYERRIVERLGEHVREELQRRREAIERTGESVVELEGRVRYAWIDRVIEQVVKQKGRAGAAMPVADRILTHPVLGLLIFLVLMGICFESIYGWAAPVMDGMERGFSALGTWLGGMLPAGPLRSLVADGIVAGVGAVLVFLPQILILFLFIAILEDCGYMARAAFVMDRWMSRLGLSGQSFIPLLSCFACAVPGILATRTIDNRRDRFVTILVAPLMTCSARIPVYVLMIGALIPPVSWLGGWLNLQGLVLLGLYALGMVTAIVVALILKRTLFPGEGQAFLMELPAYRRPSLKHVVYRMYSQGKEFCVSAGTIIFAVTVIIWALGYYPRPRAIADRYEARRAALRAEYAAVADDEAGEELQRRLAEIDREESGAYFRQSFLARMGRWIEPAVRPLGWDWRIGTAAIASFPAREVVVATMGTIYNLGDEADEQSQGLREKLKEATWPDGRAVFNPAVALSIMVFFALCCQCGGTLATIRRETRSWRWPVFTFTYMTVLAYIGALVTYQVTIRLI
ncbi:MAG: ferrous iron transporter B [Planctomycetota bacterium]|nr:MAG: ferrous iron transporter B [Planctomycetota bacterium]